MQQNTINEQKELILFLLYSRILVLLNFNNAHVLIQDTQTRDIDKRYKMWYNKNVKRIEQRRKI